MAELPKSVRDRLAAAQASDAAGHPDSDVLAAFSENALLESERDRVLAHLALCPECREVVALAQPELVVQPIVADSRKRAWFEWKVFRVGAAVAAVAVVAIAVLLHDSKSTHKSGFDDTSFARPTSTAPAELEPGAASEPSSSHSQAEHQMALPSVGTEHRARLAKKTSAPKMEAHARAVGNANEPNTHPVVRKEKDAGGQATERLLDNQVAMVASAPAPPPPLPESKTADSAVAARPKAVGGIVNEARPSSQAAPMKAAAESHTGQLTVEASAAASPLQQQKIGSQTQAAPLAMRQGTQVAFQHAIASRWRITEEGLLQRFIADEEWRTFSPGGQSDFRAVASAGNHVWAGGSSGLFHSSDGGDHWSRVNIGGTEEKDIGEIVSIRMANANELSVFTASGEAWSTRNGGRTWSRKK